MSLQTLQPFAPAAIVPLVFLDRALRHRALRLGGPEETGVNFLLGGITLFSNGLTVGLFALFYQAVASEVALVRIPSLPLELLLAVVLGDFLSYVHHRCMHAWPVLWASHIVHHQSRTIDLSTGLRNHPFAIVGTCLAWGLLLPLGIRLEIMLAAAGIIGTYDVLVHRTEGLGRGRFAWLGLVLNLPAHHRVHHSADAAYYNSNYALLFIVWDRLFGTYHAPEPSMRSFGVEGVPSTGRVRTLLWAEWLRLLNPRRTPARETDPEGGGAGIALGIGVYLAAVAALALMSLLLGFPPL